MRVDDFEDFFKALWGYEPFPWQSALIRRVAEQGWPETLDLPTSSGKSSAIDIALFHLALEADKNPRDRRAPVRIIFTIDRRLVVDGTYERAHIIRDKLAQAEPGTILAKVADSLRNISGSAPLKVIRLRGGVPRERVFIEKPMQPTIILSTVDQVGSRLLFQGYGISQRQRPIHAALVGMDSLIILDEAHLSRPFEETLAWVRRYQSDAWAEMGVGKPATVVRMTATPSESMEELLQAGDWIHPVLGPRLTCSKPAKLLDIAGDKEKPEETRQKLVETLVSQAISLMPQGGEPVVGVVVNQVATARQAFELLCSKKGEADAILLIGRARPLDRDALIQEYLDRMRAGRKEGDNPCPLYVVATQTIEVGADLDFDALVTESAALDALRQRFGRLNRLGRHKRADAVIVHVDYGRSKNPDPVYGDTLAATWKWMTQKAGKKKVIDFGIQAMKGLLQSMDTTQMLTPRKQAPVLMPAHLDMFVQTSPVPAVVPEVAPYLHGPATEPEDVQVVWRADLPAEPRDDAEILEIASVLPPASLETLALPVRVARAFLAGIARADISDVEGGEGIEANSIREISERYAVLWRGEDPEIIHDPNMIAPGDRIIIPATYGGLDKFGWHPESELPVIDIGDEAASQQHGRLQLRIHPGLLSAWFEDPQYATEAAQKLNRSMTRFVTEDVDLSEICDSLIEDLLRLPVNADIGKKLTELQSNRIAIPYPERNPEGILIRKVPQTKTYLSQEVLLTDHCRGVAELSKAFATGCGLPNELVANEVLAGKAHDLGKADPRFQLSLYEANPIAMRKANKILAKSINPNNDLKTIREYRRQSGYPRGTRHECYSVALIRDQELYKSTDKDLTLHLVGTHHGKGRPFLPAIDDPGTTIKYEFEDEPINFSGQHGLERLDSGWADRFWKLNRRYGYWGLAYLETLLRLADFSRSAEEEVIDE